jgi:predicted transcriptional regulator YdeE
MTTEIYDIQCFENGLIYTGYSLQEDKYFQFTIDGKNNDIEELYNHIFRDKEYVMVGFGNIESQYPILHYIISNNEAFFSMAGYPIANNIHRYKLSLKEDKNTLRDIVYGKHHVPQIDLDKIWYFSNKDKVFTIEELKFVMQWPNLAKPDCYNDTIFDYSKDNVNCLRRLLDETLGEGNNPIYKHENKIAVRDLLSEKYKLDATNMNDVELVERIILWEYCRKNKCKKEDITSKQQRVTSVKVKDCFPNWFKVESKEILDAVEKLHSHTINVHNPELNENVILDDFVINLNLKGVSGCVKPGVYTAGRNDSIIEMDVTSMFPSLITNLELYPAHMNESFVEIYSNLLDLRLKATTPHHKDLALSKCLKRGLNAIWGKLGKEGHWLCDPLMKYRVSISGQLYILMFLDRLLKHKVQFLVVNTDCITIMVNNDAIPMVNRIIAFMYEATGLKMKIDLYDNIVIYDGNNYMTSDIFDCYGKGIFDSKPGYLKSNNNLIIPIMLKEFFRYGKTTFEIARKHKNIFDFCQKNETKNGITRVYPSKTKRGQVNLSYYTDNTDEPDYDFYCKKAGRYISEITQQQQTLF